MKTGLAQDKLFLTLLRIQTEAVNYMEEQGVNILFLALGFLHWYEADSSEIVRKAPLLLVPVELVRKGSKSEFRLAFTDDNIVQNLSLSALLKTDHNLSFPEYLEEASEDAEDLPPLGEFYASVAECVSKLSRWKVLPDEIHLGFFSFGKFLMFNDLDPAVWPEDKQPSDHPVLGRLLGEGFDEKPFVSDSEHLDDIIQPGDVKFVRDADSSQTVAILEAREGRNLVIQGPPGTGKSQTITNIIAELIGQGKTVLFVAEKMAALEVVQRRLEECHLGDAVLELHSNKSNKTSVLKELDRTLSQGEPLVDTGSRDIESLTAIRLELNKYCKAVNTTIGSTKTTFIMAIGHYLKLKREHPGLPRWSFESMQSWTDEDFLRNRELVEELTRHLQAYGIPSINPFWGSKALTFSPIEQSNISENLVRSIQLLDQISTLIRKLASSLRLSRPATMADVAIVCRAAQRAAEAPKLIGIRLTAEDWQSNRDSIRRLIDAGSRMSELKSKHGGTFIEQVWRQDLLEVRQNLMAIGGKWWRGFSKSYRGSVAHLQGLCKVTLPKQNKDRLALVDGILEYQKYREVYDRSAILGETLYGAQWNREESDWGVLHTVNNWIVALYDDLGEGRIPPAIIDFLSGNPDIGGLGPAIDSVRSIESTFKDAIATILIDLKLQDNDSLASMFGLPVDLLREKLQRWLNDLPSLHQHARFNILASHMLSRNLGELVSIAAQWDRKPEDLTFCLDYSWYSLLIEASYSKTPELSQFDSVKQRHLVEQFNRLDRASLGHAQSGLAKSIWERKPRRGQPGEMQILGHELNKKRRHMPIRKLIDQAGRAIQAIKPIFMMSPMSIANFLPPGKIEFDVVIFDEASQVKSVDAFGALARGRQVIVVGDTKQMPPSDFFGREAEIEDDDNVTSDIESILSLFRARGAQERSLTWHYRSRHESLISVSNEEFYDRKLVVFPSSGTNQLATGLDFHHNPDALYDRGRTRTNKVEAQAIAKAVIEHAAKKSGLSLGVVAFSVAQRDLIIVEIELLRKKHPELDDFFSRAHPTERFFVNNLENVQGHERDCILISIGYGRNESGKISKEFGPINQVGGERRLNVLITRAKMSMEVFSNFRADDLELDANASHGVRALKHFLKYAETGKLDSSCETGKGPDSPFEEEVIHMLSEKGYRLEPQVGASGYFIDIAVKDPDYPGRYLLAVECDGATYHSSRSARDRDRLRQGVLESLGWRFHRIWSTDWFRNPQQELGRAVEAIEYAKAANHSEAFIPTKTDPGVGLELQRLQSAEAHPQEVAIKYQKIELPRWLSPVPLHEAPISKLIHLIGLVAAYESPVHEADVTKRILKAFGVSRAGSRISDIISEAMKKGHSSGAFFYANGFIYQDRQKHVVVRDRSDFESSERKIEYVAPEELDAALLQIIDNSFSIERNVAVSNALNLLGFGRATMNIFNAMNERLERLISRGAIKNIKGVLMPLSD